MTRCFERVFEDAQAFNKCANDLNKQTSLPQSVLESPDKGLEGGVEQCVCDCKYVEKQSPIETPTGMSKLSDPA